jgi:hypothetical protein
MHEQANAALDDARKDAGLTQGELWLRYFELGGMSMPLEVEAYLFGLLAPSTHDREVLVHASTNDSPSWAAITPCHMRMT